MTNIETTRLSLHPVDAAEGRRIRDQEQATGDQWADDYPFEGDIVALSAFLVASERDGEQRPFGYYRITRRLDGKAIGGIGFKGRPQDGVGEVGYGLAPSARGHGYTTEALTALTTAAARLGVGRVRADTAANNAASRRTLERAGFVRIATDTDLLHYELSPDFRSSWAFLGLAGSVLPGHRRGEVPNRRRCVGTRIWRVTQKALVSCGLM